MTFNEHKKLGIEFFNTTWDYLDKPNRTKGDNIEMIHYAHSSTLHWQLSGAPILNIVRGLWQISRVYSVLNMGESALFHAKTCYEKTIANNIDDFDLVFAHECMANAYKVLGEQKLMSKHINLGYHAIDQVTKQGDKNYCKSELDNIKK